MEGREVRLGPKLVDLLAILVMESGHAVSNGRLIDLLWGLTASAAADVTLRSHVAHLRRKLGLRGDGGGADGLAAVGTNADAGYRLDLAPDQFDVRIFERRLAEGH
jgi:DNA-binding winged helix-turn-helix (wHTH) protein